MFCDSSLLSSFLLAFSQSSQHLGIHTCSKHGSDEKRIQSMRAKLIYLYKQASFSFPTCCNEHWGRGSWCTNKSSWKWFSPSFHSKFGFFGHSWTSKLSPAMCNKRFQSLWAFKEIARGTTSNWSSSTKLLLLDPGYGWLTSTQQTGCWTCLYGKIQIWDFPGSSWTILTARGIISPEVNAQRGERSPLVTNVSENRRVSAGSVRQFELQC